MKKEDRLSSRKNYSYIVILIFYLIRAYSICKNV